MPHHVGLRITMQEKQRRTAAATHAGNRGSVGLGFNAAEAFE